MANKSSVFKPGIEYDAQSQESRTRGTSLIRCRCGAYRLASPSRILLFDSLSQSPLLRAIAQHLQLVKEKRRSLDGILSCNTWAYQLSHTHVSESLNPNELDTPKQARRGHRTDATLDAVPPFSRTCSCSGMDIHLTRTETRIWAKLTISVGSVAPTSSSSLCMRVTEQFDPRPLSVSVKLRGAAMAMTMMVEQTEASSCSCIYEGTIE
ncbi:hypothetical protein V8C44DRAFT_185580 [Trichoderma aethiopicum]